MLSILAELQSHLHGSEEEKEKDKEKEHKEKRAETHAHEIMSVISTVHQSAGKICPTFISFVCFQGIEFFLQIGHVLVATLCKFYEIHCLTQCAPSPPLDELIVQCLQCIQHWIMPSTWIFADPTTFKTLLSVIDKVGHFPIYSNFLTKIIQARGETKGYHTPTEKIKV